MPLVDDDLLVRLRAALHDPDQRDMILREIQGAQSGLGGVGSALSKFGANLQSARSPGAANAGLLGGVLGLGAGLLLRHRKKAPVNDNATTAASPGDTVTPSGAIEVPAAQAWNPDWKSAAPAAPAAMAPAVPQADLTAAPTGGAGSSLMTGNDVHGESVTSRDGGQTWKNATGAPVVGPIYHQTDIGAPGTGPGYGMRSGGRVRRFAAGGEMPEEEPEKPKKDVLLRRPMVISTTIVIAQKKPDEKKKPERKKKGGPIKPLKPAAVPPKKGPDIPPAPYAKGGRVQAPRGSGCAVRGKRFGGIY